MGVNPVFRSNLIPNTHSLEAGARARTRSSPDIFLQAIYSLLTVLLPQFDTQMLTPSNATLRGVVPAENVQASTQAPSLARSLVTLLPELCATQILAPSNTRPSGTPPAEKLPRLAPSLARSLLTVALLEFDTQILAPSNTTLTGVLPTGKLPRLAPSLARSLVTLL